MKRSKHLLLFLALSACAAMAQPPTSTPPGTPPGTPPSDQQKGPPKKRPAPPLVAALDADGDGVISASEIDNAPEALKKLDKNGDGQLTPDEVRPPRPDGPPPQDGGNKPPPPNDDNKQKGDRTQHRPPPGSPPPKNDGNNDGPTKPPTKPPTSTPQNGPEKSGPPNGPDGKHRPPSPLFEALDTDHDGIISADEITNSSASLKTLDKNGDGQLTPDEYRPAPPKDGPHNGQNKKGTPSPDQNGTKQDPPTK